MSTAREVPIRSSVEEPLSKQQKTSAGASVQGGTMDKGGKESSRGGLGEQEKAGMTDVSMAGEKAGAGAIGGGLEGATTATTGATAVSRGDVKRMWERHEAYVQSQRVLASLPSLFPNYNQAEADNFILWLAKLPLVMHRPRPVTAVPGWKAAGEILTVQWDEHLPHILAKMIDANVSCVPVLDAHRRYLGLLDQLALVVHALGAFGVMDRLDRAASLRDIARESAATSFPVQQSEAELKLESAGASGAGGEQAIAMMAPPVFVGGGSASYAGRPRWSADMSPRHKADWAGMWERRQFREARATDILSEEIPVLGVSSTSGPQMTIGEVQLPTPSAEVIAAPMTQGHSTLSVVELFARFGMHRAPILNSERFVTGLITESMLISLIGQYKDKIPSFLGMKVSSILNFLAPHRLVVIEEDALAVEAYMTLIHQRVNGGAIVNKEGVLVDSFSTRDLRGIGRRGEDFQNLWMIVREFKQAARARFPDKTPTSVHWVSPADSMLDVLSKMSDGNLHRIFVCELRNELPHPIAVITQRDVLRMLLVFCGLTLQGEFRVMTA